MKTIARLEDLTPDQQNANEGTLRGSQLLDTSVETFGAARSIVVDADGNVIAGNKTLEAAVERGLDIEVVPTTGEELVVVQRMDLDMKDPKTRLLAVLDNRTAEVGLAWDKERLEKDLASGLQLNGMFTQEELDKALNAVAVMQSAVNLAFDTPEQKAQWDAFAARIEARYKHLPASERVDFVSGFRLDAWVQEQLKTLEAESR